MAQLTPIQFSTKWIPLLADNVFQLINGPRLALLITDIKDSFASASTSAAPVVLPWATGTYYALGAIALFDFGSGSQPYKARQAGYLPAPTDPVQDANWQLTLWPAADNALYQTGTVAALRLEQGAWVPNRLYILTNRVDANGGATLPSVYIGARTPSALYPTGYVGDSTPLATEVSYDLATDTTEPVRSASAFADIQGLPTDNLALQAALDALLTKQAFQDFLGTNPAALDAFYELRAQLQQDEAGTAAILTTQGQHTQQIAANTGFIGTLTSLATTAKTNLVAAINELAGRIATTSILGSIKIGKGLRAIGTTGAVGTTYVDYVTEQALTYSPDLELPFPAGNLYAITDYPTVRMFTSAPGSNGLLVGFRNDSATQVTQIVYFDANGNSVNAGSLAPGEYGRWKYLAATNSYLLVERGSVKATSTGTTGSGTTGAVLGTGTVLTFTKDAEWPELANSTYTVDTSGAVLGVVVQARLGVNATQPSIPTSGFKQLPGGAFTAGHTHLYSFCVAPGGVIEYYITVTS
jgi:hypothetical protein